MTIIKDFLTINPYSRSGQKMEEVRAVVLHWVANPGTSAKMNRDYFESLAPGIMQSGKLRYASTQYIVGLKGEILQMMPEMEVAYHVGAGGIVDPASGKVYTDLARKVFAGKYTNDLAHYSPSYACIGIETCHTDWMGSYTDETLQSTKELVADILKRHNLTANDILTHQLIVGYKNCPKWFVDHPEKLDQFKADVAKMIS
jgi:N-acetylmuramoyl-L-alanine amidase